jgi:transglutaminase-like putative cysteine protease
VSFAREKRLLIGWLALLAPVPLPFSDTIGWPVLAVYLAAVVWFLRRAGRGATGWLPIWGMNLLGLAYLPLLAADLLVLHRGHLVAPVLHLGMFALVVKLFALVRERDKWQLAIGIFFIFLAAMGTSVHPTIVLYLGAFLVLSLVLLLRFAFFHVLADFSRDDPSVAAALPVRGLVAGATAFVLLAAVPLFAFLPRLRSPYIIGRGRGSGLVQEAAGFSDAVTLDSIDQIRTSRAVAIRVQFESGERPQAGDEMRFKAATYDTYGGGSWRRTPRRGTLRLGQGGHIVLAPGAPARWLHVWLLPLHSGSLPLPVEALQIEPKVTGLTIDQGGALSFPFRPVEMRDYRVGIGSRPVLLGTQPAAAPGDPTLDLTGSTPRIAALAARVAGGGTAAQRAERLERHLAGGYTYTLDLGGRNPDVDPLEDFLFRYKSGQCEYFASAMVLMLRSQGIPARLVTGFLGGEYNPFEGNLVLRDSNAHAWVEAYLGARDGWRTFDPTPPSGRPAESAGGAWLLARQAWDFVQFRWDRYVLTYGVYDQLAFFGTLRRAWSSLMAVFEPSHPAAAEAAPAPGAGTVAAAPPPAAGDSAAARLLRSPWPALALLVLAAVALLAWKRLRPAFDAAAAYGRLRQRLARAGLSVPPALPPLALQALAAQRLPEAAPATARIIALYLDESFGGRELAEADRAVLRAALAEAEARLRIPAPRRRPAAEPAPPAGRQAA